MHVRGKLISAKNNFNFNFKEKHIHLATALDIPKCLGVACTAYSRRKKIFYMYFMFMHVLDDCIRFTYNITLLLQDVFFLFLTLPGKRVVRCDTVADALLPITKLLRAGTADSLWIQTQT